MKISVVILSLCLLVSTVCFAETTKVQGVVSEVAADGSYIVVGTTKILTTAAFLDEAYIQKDDLVEITADATPDGLKAVDYEFIYEGGDSSNQTSTDNSMSMDEGSMTTDDTSTDAVSDDATATYEE